MEVKRHSLLHIEVKCYGVQLGFPSHGQVLWKRITLMFERVRLLAFVAHEDNDLGGAWPSSLRRSFVCLPPSGTN